MTREEAFMETYNPCDECDYSYSKNNQDMGMCKICEFKQLLEESERKKGRWENGEPCPICGEDRFKDLYADIWADWQPSFCPNCGADMRGE